MFWLLRRITFLTVLVLSAVSFDQLTKQLAVERLAQGGVISALGDLLRLEYAENAGAFLSLGHSLEAETRVWLFVGATGTVLLLAVLYALFERALSRAQLLAIAMMIGGGTSNLIDRIERPGGRVVDFMNLQMGGLRTGIFNVADVLILLGVLLFLATVARATLTARARARRRAAVEPVLG